MSTSSSAGSCSAPTSSAPNTSPPAITPALDKSPDGARTLLKRGRDLRKDQSYFLFSLRQEQLARALFPLGETTKTEARALARGRNFRTADKEESMEICFVPDDDYRKFLQDAKLVQKHRGEIVDLQGQVLGEHDGIEFYTIGQRRGLGIASAKPLYVVELDAARNRVIVGDDSALERDEFVAERCNWIAFDPPPAIVRGHRQNPLQPSRRARNRDSARGRQRQGQTARSPARHHPRPGRRLLPGRPRPGRRLDHACMRRTRP